MQKLFTAILVLALSSPAISGAQQAPNVSSQPKKQKMLVTYFSFPENTGVDASSGASRIVADGKVYGTTEYVAKGIAEVTGADVFRIQTVHAYPNSSHNGLTEYAKKEADTKTFPQITSRINRFADYEVVFVGYPNWWYDMPRVIYTLFNEYDFSGKTIVLFCTHGSSGFSQSVQTVKNLEKQAKVLNIPAIPNRNAVNSLDGIATWLKEQNFAK